MPRRHQIRQTARKLPRLRHPRRYRHPAQVTRHFGLALQLHFHWISESMGNHDPGYDEWQRVC
jgi:hypothetical protein